MKKILLSLGGGLAVFAFVFSVNFAFAATCPVGTAQELFQENISIPSNGSFVSSNTLVSGKTYLIEASGTYNYGPSIADAKCSERTNVIYGPGWVKGELLPSPWKNFLQIWINGAFVSDNWGTDCNITDHTYATLYNGAGSAINFSVKDNAYTDNSVGSLSADIYYCNPDVDDDGVLNTQDKCDETEADVLFNETLGVNRHAWFDMSEYGEKFTTLVPSKKGEKKEVASAFSLTDTYGCSCTQILGKLKDAGLGEFGGHYKFGCSKSVMEDFIKDFNDGVIDGRYFIETVNVPANQSTNKSSANPLVLGVNYVLKASGTANAGDGIQFDADYSYRTPTSSTWTDAVSTYEYLGDTLLDLFVNDASVNWGAYNGSNVYEYGITGNGSNAAFKIYDTYPSNNTGSLTVDIYAEL